MNYLSKRTITSQHTNQVTEDDTRDELHHSFARKVVALEQTARSIHVVRSSTRVVAVHRSIREEVAIVGMEWNKAHRQLVGLAEPYVGFHADRWWRSGIRILWL